MKTLRMRKAAVFAAVACATLSIAHVSVWLLSQPKQQQPESTTNNRRGIQHGNTTYIDQTNQSSVNRTIYPYNNKTIKSERRKSVGTLQSNHSQVAEYLFNQPVPLFLKSSASDERSLVTVPPMQLPHPVAYTPTAIVLPLTRYMFVAKRFLEDFTGGRPVPVIKTLSRLTPVMVDVDGQLQPGAVISTSLRQAGSGKGCKFAVHHVQLFVDKDNTTSVVERTAAAIANPHAQPTHLRSLGPRKYVLGACVKPLLYMADWIQIIEFMESAVAVGIEQPYIYWTSVDESSMKVLDWYKRMQLYELVEWSWVGHEIENWLYYTGQVEVFHDCLHQVTRSASHDWLALLDLDESLLITPTHGSLNFGNHLAGPKYVDPTIGAIRMKRIEYVNALQEFKEKLTGADFMAVCLKEMRFDVANSTLLYVHFNGKSIVRPEAVLHGALHYSTVYTGYKVVNMPLGTGVFLHRRRTYKAEVWKNREQVMLSSKGLQDPYMSQLSELNERTNAQLTERLAATGGKLFTQSCLPFSMVQWLTNPGFSQYGCPALIDENKSDMMSLGRIDWIKAAYAWIPFSFHTSSQKTPMVARQRKPTAASHDAAVLLASSPKATDTVAPHNAI